MNRILIVDDEPNVRLNYRLALELEGYEVIEANSGQEALRQLRISKFPVAVIDLRMPGLSGIDLIKASRTHGVQTKFLVVTAYGDNLTATRALQAGAVAVLGKPLRPQELATAVYDVLNPVADQVTPESCEQYLAAARERILAKDYAAAQRELLRAVEANDEALEAYLLAAEISERIGDLDRSRKLYERCLLLEPSSPQAREGLRRVFQKLHVTPNSSERSDAC
jgi:DNA-binding NtrC family response regulator